MMGHLEGCPPWRPKYNGTWRDARRGVPHIMGRDRARPSINLEGRPPWRPKYYGTGLEGRPPWRPKYYGTGLEGCPPWRPKYYGTGQSRPTPFGGTPAV